MPTTTSTISHEIAVTLRTEILSQRYRSGDRLPSERDLAARFAASRGAVREALSQIEQIGLINIQPGGARVKPVDEASIAILGPLLALNEVPDASLVDQFLQTFAALSAANAREALALADKDQIQEIQTLLARLRKRSADAQASQQHWVELLEYLAEVANNLVVRLIANDLKNQFLDRMLREQVKPSIKKRNLNEIVDVLVRAVDERDREQFANAVLRYFDELRLAVTQDISQRMAS